MFLSKLGSWTTRIVQTSQHNILFKSLLHNNSLPAASDRIIIEAGKRDLPQSPWKVNLIARLVRNLFLNIYILLLKKVNCYLLT